MRNVFIDLGAGSGDDIQGFYDLDINNKFAEVYAFEANPARTKEIEKRFRNIDVYNVKVYTAAVGTENTTANLYFGKSLNASSLNENKVSIDTTRSISVSVIDLCEFIKEKFHPDDYITVVMDIEGAEYDLLEKMYQEGLWDWINEFYVEFHGEKIADFDMGVEEDLTNRLIETFDDKVYIFRKHNHEQFLKLNAEGV